MSTKSDIYIETKRLVNVARSNWVSNGLCVICGENPATTQEHVPPKSIFCSKVDLVTVPACQNCQDTPDREFRTTLAGLCTTSQQTDSGQLFIKNVSERLKDSDGQPRKEFLDSLESTKRKVWFRSDSGLLVPLVVSDPPSEFVLPILTKIAAGFYWLFERGRNVLANELGNLIIQWDVNGYSEKVNGLLKDAYLGTHVAGGEFIALSIQWETTGSPVIMSMHFYSNANGDQPNSLYGYHVIAYFMLDKFRVTNASSREMDRLLKLRGKHVSNIPTSDIKYLVHGRPKLEKPEV